MKKQKLIVSLVSLAILGFSAPAFARMPADAGDIRTGADLVVACRALSEHDVSEDGALASKACSAFLGTMVQKVYSSTEAGAPTQFSRIGPNEDQIACFRLPPKLSFVDFASLILAYANRHPELADRPAFETGAFTLSTNFPCVEYDPSKPRQP
ncbi:MAG: Rap1a/Tai family immunity protein [Parvibaculum sp.]